LVYFLKKPEVGTAWYTCLEKLRKHLLGILPRKPEVVTASYSCPENLRKHLLGILVQES
jgi:hypothetical protein